MSVVFNLSQLLQDVLAELGQIADGVATGGGSDFVTDSALIKQGGKKNVWKNGTLFIVEDAGLLGAAPENEYKIISAYDDTLGKFTGLTAFSADPAAGDAYAFASDYYPLQTMIRMMNLGLTALGEIIVPDIVTLDTEGNKTEYDAAAEWKRRPPSQIDFQTVTGDADDNQWETVWDWEFVSAAPGTAGKIIFGHQPVASRDIRVWYYDAHPRLNSYEDVVSETIPKILAIASCVERALRWQNSRLGGGDKFLLARWNDAKRDLEMALQRNPIWRPLKRARSKLAGMDSDSGYTWVKRIGE